MDMDIYTDGSCRKGYGGWAFMMLEPNYIIYGDVENTTNNRMELQAVIEALEFVKEKSIRIHTDSQLVMKCAQGEWKRKANLDLWEIYDRLSKDRIIEWIKVKAHSGILYNEIVDKFAKKGLK